MLLMMKSMKNHEKMPQSTVQVKNVCNPAAQNMPHEEDFDNNNYELIDETAI